MVDRKFYTGAKERRYARYIRRVSDYKLNTARFKWRSIALKRKISKQKIKRLRLRMEYNKLANLYIKEVTSSKYKNYRIANITRFIWKNGTAIQGRIEFKYNGSWGTACSDTFGSNQDSIAKVFCKSMGFKFNRYWIRPYFGGGKGNILLDNLNCDNQVKTAKTLDQCTHNTIGTHNCNHAKDLGVVCHQTNMTSNPNYKLENQ